jgi:hypothetical protein
MVCRGFDWFRYVWICLKRFGNVCVGLKKVCKCLYWFGFVWICLKRLEEIWKCL